MKRINNLLIKFGIITVLMAVTVVFLLSSPADDSQNWIAVFSWSKFVGLAAGYAMIQLTRRWLGALVAHMD